MGHPAQKQNRIDAMSRAQAMMEAAGK